MVDCSLLASSPKRGTAENSIISAKLYSGQITDGEMEGWLQGIVFSDFRSVSGRDFFPIAGFASFWLKDSARIDCSCQRFADNARHLESPRRHFRNSS